MFSKRVNGIQLFFMTTVSFFVVYLFAIQVLDIRHFRIKAKNQRKANSFVLRGDIYDRNGNVVGKYFAKKKRLQSR